MSRPRILALVLAGGEGRRLRPLTEDRAKPAVELGHGYRIIDFVLANLVNSDVRSIYLLAQYKPGPLIEHVARIWRPSLSKRGFHLRAILPETPYLGTADAVYRNLHLVAEHEPDAVAVLAADHVYRMDLRPMVAFHEHRRADAAVAAMPVPLADASRFGVLRVDAASRVRDFREKPRHPVPMPGDPGRAFVSMGNYVFAPEALVELLEDSRGKDFGHDVLPYAVRSGARLFAYDFASNRVPGVKPYEDPAYWRDVGTVQSLAEARRDIEGARPRFDLRNPDWPLQPAAVRSF